MPRPKTQAHSDPLCVGGGTHKPKAISYYFGNKTTRRSDSVDDPDADCYYIFEGYRAAKNFLTHIEVASRNLIVDRQLPTKPTTLIRDVERQTLPDAENESETARESIVTAGIAVRLGSPEIAMQDGVKTQRDAQRAQLHRRMSNRNPPRYVVFL